MRSMQQVFSRKIVCYRWITALSVIEACYLGNLIICQKSPVLSKLTMDQSNLLGVTVQAHTQWKNNILLRNILKLRYFNTDNEFNRKIIDENIDFNIPGLPNSTVHKFHKTSFRELIQKIENHPNRQSLQPKIKKNGFVNLGTSNCVNYLIWNPKQSARCVYHTGTSASSTARAGTSFETETEENTKFVQYTMDLFSILNFYIKKKPHGHENYIANWLKKKCKKRNFLGFHDRFICDEKFSKNMIDVGRTEELCREIDKLAYWRPHAPHYSRRN